MNHEFRAELDEWFEKLAQVKKAASLTKKDPILEYRASGNLKNIDLCQYLEHIETLEHLLLEFTGACESGEILRQHHLYRRAKNAIFGL
jgi:hypothetical protein